MEGGREGVSERGREGGKGGKENTFLPHQSDYCSQSSFSPRSVTLHNRSSVVVHYQWKAFSSEADEDIQRQM